MKLHSVQLCGDVDDINLGGESSSGDTWCRALWNKYFLPYMIRTGCIVASLNLSYCTCNGLTLSALGELSSSIISSVDTSFNYLLTEEFYPGDLFIRSCVPPTQTLRHLSLCISGILIGVTDCKSSCNSSIAQRKKYRRQTSVQIMSS